MNISKLEQRVLHALAQGGMIRHDRDDAGRITSVLCITRDGMILSDCTLPLFQRLRRRRLIGSVGGNPGARCGRNPTTADPVRPSPRGRGDLRFS
jgi:uncharacterized protein YjhX (UPF0386 family)